MFKVLFLPLDGWIRNIFGKEVVGGVGMKREEAGQWKCPTRRSASADSSAHESGRANSPLSKTTYLSGLWCPFLTVSARC